MTRRTIWPAGSLLVLALLAPAACAKPPRLLPWRHRQPLPHRLPWLRPRSPYSLILSSGSARPSSNRATAVQAYRLASLMLDRAMADRAWTAALEQTGDFASKPPAVILDVDETVLDNSESEERDIREGAVYSEARWRRGATSERPCRFPARSSSPVRRPRRAWRCST